MHASKRLNQEQAGDSMSAQDVIAAVKPLAPILRQRQLEAEAARRVSEDSIRDLDQAGVFRIALPARYGGIDVTAIEHFQLLVELGKGCPSTAWLCWATSASALACMFPEVVAEQVLRNAWAGPRLTNVGGTSRARSGTARPVPGGWMIKGTWPFATGCLHASHISLACFTSDEDAPPGIALVPISDVVILDDWRVKALAATGSNSVQLVDELFVPDERFIAPEDTGIAAARLEAATSFSKPGGIYTSVAIGTGLAIGAAEAALDEFVEQVPRRSIPYSDYSRQGEAPVTHLSVGQAQCMISAARCLAEHNLDRVDQYSREGTTFLETDLHRFAAETGYIWRQCAEATEILYRSAGASAIYEKNGLQRYARDLRAASMHAANNFDTFAENFGRVKFGLEPFGTKMKWSLSSTK